MDAYTCWRRTYKVDNHWTFEKNAPSLKVESEPKARNIYSRPYQVDNRWAAEKNHSSSKAVIGQENRTYRMRQEKPAPLMNPTVPVVKKPEAVSPYVERPNPPQPLVEPENDVLRRLFLSKGIDIGGSVKLGAGRYSKVIAAKQLVEDGQIQKIAIKIINLNNVTADFRLRFLPREIACWRRLCHPSLIPLRGHYEAMDKVFLTMSFGEKGDLLRFVQKNGPTAEPQARIWMNQVLQGVRYMHSEGIAHRDLKLENLILFGDGSLKVADFGFCRQVHGHSTTYCGSKSYSAPEILIGRPYDPFKADVWSLGVIFYILVTDRMPFREGSSNKVIVEEQKARKYRYPRRLALSQECTAAADLMMTFDANYRPTVYTCLTLPFFKATVDATPPVPTRTIFASQNRQSKRQERSQFGR